MDLRQVVEKAGIFFFLIPSAQYYSSWTSAPPTDINKIWNDDMESTLNYIINRSNIQFPHNLLWFHSVISRYQPDCLRPCAEKHFQHLNHHRQITYSNHSISPLGSLERGDINNSWKLYHLGMNSSQLSSREECAFFAIHFKKCTIPQPGLVNHWSIWVQEITSEYKAILMNLCPTLIFKLLLFSLLK